LDETGNWAGSFTSCAIRVVKSGNVTKVTAGQYVKLQVWTGYSSSSPGWVDFLRSSRQWISWVVGCRHSLNLVAQLVHPAVFLASIPLPYLVSSSAARLSLLLLLVLKPVVGILASRRATQE
jgi:hypothetical protein